MILTGDAIRQAVAGGDIVIEPFEDHLVGPNSYDFHLGSRCRTYTEPVLDCARDNPSRLEAIPEDGLLVAPESIYLVDTLEIIGSSRYVPIIRGRSSTARLGVFVHVTADLIDLGSINKLTLQLHAVIPTRLYAGMRIGQVTFWEIEGKITLYGGKYRHVESPAASLSYVDFLDATSTDPNR